MLAAISAIKVNFGMLTPKAQTGPVENLAELIVNRDWPPQVKQDIDIVC
jgi:hypothetical protein